MILVGTGARSIICTGYIGKTGSQTSAKVVSNLPVSAPSWAPVDRYLSPVDRYSSLS